MRAPLLLASLLADLTAAGVDPALIAAVHALYDLTYREAFHAGIEEAEERRREENTDED